jgi:hypothetical protein
MKVISMSKDRKRAQIVVKETDPRSQDTALVTRHAHLMPGSKTKYTIRDYKLYGFKTDGTEKTIAIDSNNVVTV